MTDSSYSGSFITTMRGYCELSLQLNNHVKVFSFIQNQGFRHVVFFATLRSQPANWHDIWNLISMLRIHTSTNSSSAKKYYTSGLSTPDYYINKQQEVGRWGGKGAELLGLSGGVAQQEFFRLADNQHPQTGRKLTPRTKTVRRVGYDFTFNCPKSVSLAYSLGDSETRHIIREALENAVADTMSVIEENMHVRVRKHGANHNKMTGNMVWAAFTHDTSRPMDDGFVDPHLHSHNFVFNTTHDGESWKAGEFAAIKRDGNYFEALFHNHLAATLQEKGFAITPTKDRWELAGISRETIATFSQRTAQIETIAKENNITNIEEKSALAATTRNNKQNIRSWDEIKQNWHDRFCHNGQDSIESLRHAHSPHTMETEKAVQYALDHVFERQSVARERYVTRIALKHGVGAVKLEDVKQLLAEKTLSKQVKGETQLTTPEILQEERSMLHLVRSGRGNYKPYATKEIVIKSDFINDQQRDVIYQILMSMDRVTTIVGRAGVGKTTIMTEIAENIRANDKAIHAFAPSSDAARGVLRNEGFHGAETIARLLVDRDLQSQIKDQVMYIDEVGLVGTKTLNQVLTLAEKQNARVILSGDPKQHSSVERGDALRILEKNAGMQTHYLDTIVRQKRSLFRRAVEAVSNGNLDLAVEKLEAMGAFKERLNPQDRYEQIAREYTNSVKDKQSVLVVSPTHKEGEEITRYIREDLRQTGLLGKTDSERKVLRSLAFTNAEKTYSGNYQIGHTIQLVQNMRGFTRGEVLTVIKPTGKGHLLVARNNGEQVKFSLQHATRFEVYGTKSIALARGDMIRITQNSFTKDAPHCVTKRRRLNNGAHYQIDKIKANGEIVLTNHWILPKDFAHFKHGYVSTSHASQGKTVDKILIGQSAESFGKASTMEQFYVSVSRGKHEVSIYTNNATALKAEITKSQYRMAATELIGKPAKRESWFGTLKMAVSRYRQLVQNRTKQPSLATSIQPPRQR